MRALKSLMQERKGAILDRWLRDTMATYAVDTTNFLDKVKDPFANPVGHALRNGTRGILESLINGIKADDVCRCLDEIIKIRAIQDFSPSQAISFVFLLRGAIRAELDETTRREHSAELAKLDRDIDQIALFAFDIYSRRREHVSELRIEEVKRNVAALMQRFTDGDSSSGLRDDLGSAGDSDAASDPPGDGTTLRGGCR